MPGCLSRPCNFGDVEAMRREGKIKFIISPPTMPPRPEGETSQQCQLVPLVQSAACCALYLPHLVLVSIHSAQRSRKAGPCNLSTGLCLEGLGSRF